MKWKVNEIIFSFLYSQCFISLCKMSTLNRNFFHTDVAHSDDKQQEVICVIFVFLFFSFPVWPLYNLCTVYFSDNFFCNIYLRLFLGLTEAFFIYFCFSKTEIWKSLFPSSNRGFLSGSIDKNCFSGGD